MTSIDRKPQQGRPHRRPGWSEALRTEPGETKSLFTPWEAPERRLSSECDPTPVHGLTYQPHFLTDSEQLDLLTTIDSLPWSHELKRRVQHHGYQYDYKSRRVDRSMYRGPLPDCVNAIVHRLREIIGRDFDQLIVNEYLPGQGISAHIDCEPCFHDHIASISLGWPYEMEFHHPTTDTAFAIMLEPGSLLTLSGPARYEWTHQIRPRMKDHGVTRRRRVSLTFRKVRLMP